MNDVPAPAPAADTAEPSDVEMALSDPAMFTSLSGNENQILSHHLTSGWYKQATVYPALSEPWREPTNRETTRAVPQAPPPELSSPWALAHVTQSEVWKRQSQNMPSVRAGICGSLAAGRTAPRTGTRLTRPRSSFPGGQ